jgi:protein arginine kinase activator
MKNILLQEESIMLCELCKKNEATVHLKEFRENGVRLLHICVECAAKKEKESNLHAFGFNLAEVLFNIEQSIEKAVEKKANKETPDTPGAPASSSPVCQTCGWTAEKLQQSGGRLGCGNCYKTFAHLIQDAIDRVQFGSVHLGKRPLRCGRVNTLSLKFELEKHQQELAELIKREEYEAAAVCRDKILQLKTEIAAGNKTQEADHE